MAIKDLQDLCQHLQWAIELEHSTIPPYLFALYSITEGHNQEAVEILRSIVMEEMLHMTLAANVLNAVGGEPSLDKADFIPRYPCYLPHSNKAFQVSLEGFSPACVSTLMRIEHPEKPQAPAQDDNYATIAQFYSAIEDGLKSLCADLGDDAVFSGDPRRQIEAGGTVYAGSGRIIAVTDLDTALQALQEIIHQGEGLDYDSIWDGDRNMFHHEREEVGHYFRLQEILVGHRYKQGDTARSGPTGEPVRVDWEAVYHPVPNPRSADHERGSEIRRKMDSFNREYSEILRLLDKGFNGEPEYIARSVGAMYELRHLATELMRIPAGQGNTAGLSFEYVTAESAGSTTEPLRIDILPNGPYAIHGDIPLVRKSIVRSGLDEALAWRMEGEIPTAANYTLCRCGASSIKPFCDGSHEVIGFDGEETADTSPSRERRKDYPGSGILMQDDRPLCIHAGFCHNRVIDAWRLTQQTEDVQKRIELIGMIEHCPSGALTYLLEADGDESDNGTETGEANVLVAIEPHLARGIAVIPDGPLWVTGGLTIVRSDGVVFEVRNRVTLCRCGHSNNKPYCDGTHAEIGFTG